MTIPLSNGPIPRIRWRVRGRVLAGSLFLWAASAGAQEGVQILCVESFPEEACTCATEALAQAIDAEDFALYDAIGLAFGDERAAGAAYVPAWDAASAAVGQTMAAGGNLTSRTNAIGRAHRDAIRACGGG